MLLIKIISKKCTVLKTIAIATGILSKKLLLVNIAMTFSIRKSCSSRHENN